MANLANQSPRNECTTPLWWRRARFSSSTAARERRIEGKTARSVLRKTGIGENYDGRISHIRSEISRFSGGTVLYEMGTGQLPFRGDSTATIFDSILNRTPAPPVRLNPDLPAELDRIVCKCLQKDRNLRHQSAVDLRADLHRLKRDTESGRSMATEASSGSPVTAKSVARWKY